MNFWRMKAGNVRILQVLAALLLIVPLSYAECGNLVCESGENECNCAADCGSCGGWVENAMCQTYTCATGACAPTLALDCCGNGICERGESFGSCEWDCAPKTVEVRLEKFEQRDYLRGDNAFVQVYVSADSKPAIGASVKASGIGDVALYDDGNHSDVRGGDGIYANSIQIPLGAKKGDYVVTVAAVKTGVTGTKTFTLAVNPEIEIKLNLGKAQYSLGDIITASGTLLRAGKPCRENVSLDFIVSGRGIFHADVKPDAAGNFSIARRTSLIDPAGTWTLKAGARDENYNEGIIEQEFGVLAAEGGKYYVVSFIEPVRKVFTRGEEISFLVRVEDLNGESIQGADAEVALSDEAKVALKELAPGNYGGTMRIPLDFGLGKQKITANVSRYDGGALHSGFAEGVLYTNESPITIEIISPLRSTFSAGEKIDFRVRLLYSFDRPVENAALDLNLNGKIARAKEVGGGIYFLSHTLAKDAPADYYVAVSAADKYMNTETKNLVFSINSEFSLFYFIANDPLAVAAAIVVLLFAVIVGGLFASNYIRLRLLTGRKWRLTETKKKLQNAYFNERVIGSEEYYPLMDKYNEELGKIDATLQTLQPKK
ncbi:MAG: choice-of-anchor X domain-containing protein [Candidatus Diapherotrites archaeon]